MVKIQPWRCCWALGLVASFVLASLKHNGLSASAFCVTPTPGCAPPTRTRPLSFEAGDTHRAQGMITAVRRDGHDLIRPPQTRRSVALHVISSHNPKTKNWFVDALEQAFSNEHFAAPPEGIRASARHILLNTAEECHDAAHQIETGKMSFEEAAKVYSTCPSKHDGGSLGSFHRGTMVPEFDALVFDPRTPLRKVVGPVHTTFGYHIVVIDKRTGV
jgi:peptidyl-prolyl cis-trans isomerase C